MDVQYQVTTLATMTVRREFSAEDMHDQFAHYNQGASGPGPWGVTHGSLTITEGQQSFIGRYSPQYLDFTDGDLELVFAPHDDGGHQIGMVFRYTNSSCFYYIAFDTKPDDGWGLTPARLYRVRNGQHDLLAAHELLLTQGVAYELHMTLDQGHITAAIHELDHPSGQVQLFDIEDDDPLLTGSFGPVGYDHPGVQFTACRSIAPHAPRTISQIFDGTIDPEVHIDPASAAPLHEDPVGILMTDAIEQERLYAGSHVDEVEVQEYRVLSLTNGYAALFHDQETSTQDSDAVIIGYVDYHSLRPAAIPYNLEGYARSATSIIWSWMMTEGSVREIQVEDDENQILALLSPEDRQWAEEGLQPGERVTRRIVVISEDERQAVSWPHTMATRDEVDVAPEAPYELTGQATSTTSILWSWSFDGECDEFELIDVNTGNVAGAIPYGEGPVYTFHEQDLPVDIPASRYVVAVNTAGQSDASNLVSLSPLADISAPPPRAPEALYASILEGSVVQWNWQQPQQEHVQGFWVYSTTGEVIDLLPPNILSYREEIPAETTVGRYIRSYNQAGMSSPSPIAWVIAQDQEWESPFFESQVLAENPALEKFPYVQSGVGDKSDFQTLPIKPTDGLPYRLRIRLAHMMSQTGYRIREVPFRYRFIGTGQRRVQGVVTTREVIYDVRIAPNIQTNLIVSGTATDLQGRHYQGTAVLGPVSLQKDRGWQPVVTAEQIRSVLVMRDSRDRMYSDFSGAMLTVQAEQEDLAHFRFADEETTSTGLQDIHGESFVETTVQLRGQRSPDSDFITWNIPQLHPHVPFQGAHEDAYEIPLTPGTLYEADNLQGLALDYAYWFDHPEHCLGQAGTIITEGTGILTAYMTPYHETESYDKVSPWYTGRTRRSEHEPQTPIAVPIPIGWERSDVVWDAIDIEIECDDITELKHAWERSDGVFTDDPPLAVPGYPSRRHWRTRRGDNVLWVWADVQEFYSEMHTVRSLPFTSPPYHLKFGESRDVEITLPQTIWTHGEGGEE